MADPDMCDFEKSLPFYEARDRAVVLLAKDPLDWSRPGFGWRIRFRVEHGRSGLSHRDVESFVRKTVMPMCRGAAAEASFGLYVAEEADVQAIFRAFRDRHGQAGEIESVESQEMHDLATRIAAGLAAGLRGDPAAV